MTHIRPSAPSGPRGPRRGRRATVLGGVGLVLGVVVALVWWTVRDPEGPTTTTVGVREAEALVAGPTGSTTAAPTTTPPATTTPAAPASTPSRAAPPARAGAGPTEPVTIGLPALGLDAPVVPVGVEDDGLMEVPEDVRTVGWYRHGPAPGSPSGSAVLSGHVNDRAQGVGVFARIGELDVGDTVDVRLGNGATLTYRVVAREQWPKGQVPLDRLFDRGGSPRIVLITCGGVFDRGSRNYQDNIAVTAVPV